MIVGVVTTSYPRFAGDSAGHFVAAHVAALRAMGHTVEVIAAGPEPAAPTPRDAANTPRDAANTSRDAAPTPRDAANTPRDAAPTPRDAANTSRDAAPTSRDAAPTSRDAATVARAAESTTRAAENTARDAAASAVTRISSPLFYRGGAPDALERGGRWLGGHALDAASFALRLAAQVARRAQRWDLAIAHWLAPSALAAIPARVPLVAIAHGGDVHTLARLRLLGPALAALRLRRARLVFVSAELRALAARHGDVGDALVQPMGIDVARFSALDRAPASPPIAAVLARLVPVKGVDVAIAAMAHVRAPARLVVAGDGPERAQLARAQHDHDHGRDRDHNHVELVGALDLSARDELLRRAAVVVVPSRVLPNGRTEGMPLVALEALAAGVPVIASAVGGLRELAGPVLVPPDDPRALARAIDDVLASPPSSEQLRAAVAPLDWSIVANRLLA